MHERIGQRVAVKLLAAEAAGDPRARARFLDEARVLSRLDHPGIVRILGCDELDDGGVWVAMEQVAGESLRERLLRGPLATAEALAIAEQIAAAMSVVHAHGVVHRDLKPENVMLAGGPAPRVKIVDFGIAKVPAADRARSDDTQVETGEAVWLGSIGYMAPEQYRDAASAGAPADVYSLGVMLYEMIEGERPFEADDAIEVAAMHLRDAPPPFAANVPEATEALVLAMLDKDPACRPTMEQVRAALVRPVETFAPLSRRRVAWPTVARWGVVGAALLVAAGALYKVHRTYGVDEAFLSTVEHDVEEDDWTLAEKPDTLPERERKLADYATHLAELESSHRVLRLRSEVAHRRGDNALRWHTLREAASFYEEALRLIPDGEKELRGLNASKRGKVALARYRLMEARTLFDEALRLFNELLATDPGNPEFRRDLAISEEEEAELLLEEASVIG